MDSKSSLGLPQCKGPEGRCPEALPPLLCCFLLQLCCFPFSFCEEAGYWCMPRIVGLCRRLRHPVVATLQGVPKVSLVPSSPTACKSASGMTPPTTLLYSSCHHLSLAPEMLVQGLFPVKLPQYPPPATRHLKVKTWIVDFIGHSLLLRIRFSGIELTHFLEVS